jgi:Cdc6-like AAA superfamily ATPase
MKTEKSPFIFNEPVAPPIFAGRSKELAILNQSIFELKESVILFGNDAIGKSSIVKTIHKSVLNSMNKEVLPVQFSAIEFINAIDRDFLAFATHKICTTIWTRLIKKNYSELIEESLFNTSSINSSPEEVSLKRIYRIVTSSSLSSVGNTSKEIGGKLFLEGKYIQNNEVSNSRKPLESFEFLMLLDELNDIIEHFGFKSIIVFCDELNHLPENVNSQILKNYFDVFSSKKIQFVIVSVNPYEQHQSDAENLIKSFHCSLEIKSFEQKEAVEELLLNAILNKKIELENGIVDYLFNFTGGHPWWIQKICDQAYSSLLANKSDLIDFASIEKASFNFKNEIAHYNKLISEGKPFRKFDLKFLNNGY